MTEWIKDKIHEKCGANLDVVVEMKHDIPTFQFKEEAYDMAILFDASISFDEIIEINDEKFEKFFGKEVIILGGGCGLAPIRSLLYALEHVKDNLQKVILCYGSKTPSDCIYKPLFSRLNKIEKFEAYRTVDKADSEWDGPVGVATTLLNKININLKNSVAVVCGPPIMMKFGTLKFLEMGYTDDQIYLSMEKNMSCGLGKCGHCMMGEFFVCKDGPVFTYNEIKNTPDIWK